MADDLTSRFQAKWGFTRSLTRDLLQFVDATVVTSVANTTEMEEQLAPASLEKTDAHGLPGDFRNAVAHGMLAALTLDGVPANVPSATGASGTRLLGSLTPGSSANWARCVAWMAAQTAPLTAA